jgi:type II secretory pathway pseudopilin PulG
MSRPRPVSGHDRDQAGMTLVELVVVIAISLLVGGILLGFLDNTTSVVGRATGDIQAENDARLALRTMTQDIRAARPSSISSTSLIPTAGACPTTPSAANCLSFRIRRRHRHQAGLPDHRHLRPARRLGTADPQRRRLRQQHHDQPQADRQRR